MRNAGLLQCLAGIRHFVYTDIRDIRLKEW